MDRLHRYFKLVDYAGNAVDWKVNRFPDGQIQFVIAKDDVCKVNKCICSIQNSECLDMLLQMIHTLGTVPYNIVYLYGARCDKDTAGDNRVCNIPELIDILVFHKAIAQSLMPHCMLSTHYPWILPDKIINNENKYDLLLFPDKSAYKRYFMSNAFTHTSMEKLPYFRCDKLRDQGTGNIINYTIPEEVFSYNRILMMDDLCDGGRTFLNIGTELREKNPKIEQLDLLVCHGVFSGEAPGCLFPVFDKIYVSNSIESVENRVCCFGEKVEVIDVWN